MGNSERHEVLLVSAARFELGEILASLPQGVSSFECGVGSINAAKHAKELGRAVAGKHVIFVGTAGVFGDFASPTLMRARDVHWEPTGVRIGSAYTVNGTAPAFDLSVKPCFSDIFSALPGCSVICSPEISLVPAPSAVKTSLPRVENLELYSVAQELAASSKTLDVILCTTNTVGEESHVQWKENFRKAANMTSRLILEAIAARSRP